MSFQKFIAEINACATKNGDGLSRLTELERKINKSRQLDSEEKEELTDAIINLQQTLADVDKSLLGENETEDVNWCRVSYDYDSYVTHQDKEPWESLNADNLPYPEWLANVAIKEFFPYLPNIEVISKVLAAACFINANSVPPASQLVDDEVSIPRLYVYGVSGVGKTRLARFIGKHYKGKAFLLLIPEGKTGVHMRNLIHQTCTGNRETIRPSCVVLDNIYAHQLTNPGDNFVALRTALLADKRSQALSGTGRPGDQEDRVYQLLSFYILTSINPISAVSMKAKEIQRRCLPINCGERPLPDLIKRYDFSKVSSIYESYWTKQQWSDSFIKFLGETSQIDPEDLEIDSSQWGISQLLIATGCHVGIWKSIDEAIELITEYWHLVGSESSNTDDAVLLLVNAYFEEVLPRKVRRSLVKEDVYNKIDKDELFEYVAKKTKSASGGQLERQLIDIMSVRGYKLQTLFNQDLYFVKDEET